MGFPVYNGLKKQHNFEMSAEKSRVKLFGKRKKIVLICLVIHHLHIHEIHENRIQMYVY